MTIKKHKFSLSDTELRELLLVSSVIRGVRVTDFTENEENDYETVTSIERDSSKETFELNKNDETQ
jgi:hypothetical protein